MKSALQEFFLDNQHPAVIVIVLIAVIALSIFFGASSLSARQNKDHRKNR